MKRLCFCAAVTAALLAPATATAATSSYKGGFSSSGILRFKVAKASGHKFIPKDSFVFDYLPLDCTDANHTGSARVALQIRIRHNKFHKKLVATSDPSAATLKIVGQLKHHGAKAMGTVDLKGAAVPIDGGGTGDCHSGAVHWTAARTGR